VALLTKPIKNPHMIPVVIAAELLTARRVLRVFRLARFANKAVNTASRLDHLLNKKEIAAHDAASYELIHEPIHGEDIYIMMHGLAIFNMYRGQKGSSLALKSDDLAAIISHPFTTPEVKAVSHDPVSKIYAYFEDLFRQLNSNPTAKIDSKTLSALRNSFKEGVDMKVQFIANAIHADTNKALILATSMLGYDPGDAVFMSKSVREGTLGLNSKLETASGMKNFLPLTLVSLWISMLDRQYIDSASTVRYDGADFSVILRLGYLPINQTPPRRTIKTVSTRGVLPADVKRVTQQLEELYLGVAFKPTKPKDDEEENKLFSEVREKATSSLNELAHNKKYK
jgi:hypothetical protein